MKINKAIDGYIVTLSNGSTATLIDGPRPAIHYLQAWLVYKVGLTDDEALYMINPEDPTVEEYAESAHRKFARAGITKIPVITKRLYDSLDRNRKEGQLLLNQRAKTFTK